MMSPRVTITVVVVLCSFLLLAPMWSPKNSSETRSLSSIAQICLDKGWVFKYDRKVFKSNFSCSPITE